MKKSDKGKAPIRSSRSRRPIINPHSALTNVPNDYLAMMKDIQDEAKKIDDSRPLKRKRVGGGSNAPDSTISRDSDIISISSDESEKGRIVVEISDGDDRDEEDIGDVDEDEEEDEMEWDDINLLNVTDHMTKDSDNYQPQSTDEANEKEKSPSSSSTPGITISLSGNKNKSPVTSRTKTHLTKEEKADRLLIHKLQLLCLLHHVSLRNKWCNDFQLRLAYRKVLSNNILKELYPPEHLSSTLKTRKFLDGLRHACKAWNDHFRITHKGLRMLAWNEIFDKSRLIESKMGLSKFKYYLLKFRGSNDLSAQGFCALLRSIDIDTRLVCSLQPLDFTSNVPIEEGDSNKSNRHTTPNPESEYPIYWVEAWDPAGLRWVTVNPTAANSVEVVRGRSKLEPPQSDCCNNLRYVIGFEVNGRARDVTRRYAFHYNSKTRKKRITSTESGRLWWERVMRHFSPRHLEPRDIAELSELNKREASESLPTSIQDFKGHPIFVLEQHLHQNEVLDPKVPCGTLALKLSKKVQKGSLEEYTNGRICPIYRRKDVKIVRSAQAWYRLGRVVKSGAQPLKHTKARKLPSSKYSDTADGVEEEENIGQYSLDQTSQYIPPPVENGEVPRNGFGNIDVYVPSMVPAGGCHLRYPNVALAAKIVGIDYADAVCGFDFTNRKMTPKIEGIVIAEEFKEAVMLVYYQLVEEKEQETRRMAETKALLRWKRYLIALQIKSRLDRVHGKVDVGELDQSNEEVDNTAEIDELESDRVIETTSISADGSTITPKKLFDFSDIKLIDFVAAVAAEREEDSKYSDTFEGDSRNNAIVLSSGGNSVEPEDRVNDRHAMLVDIVSPEPEDRAEHQHELRHDPQSNTRLLSNLPSAAVSSSTYEETQADELDQETQATSFVESQSRSQDLDKNDSDSSDGGFVAESMSESELLADLDAEDFSE